MDNEKKNELKWENRGGMITMIMVKKEDNN